MIVTALLSILIAMGIFVMIPFVLLSGIFLMAMAQSKAKQATKKKSLEELEGAVEAIKDPVLRAEERARLAAYKKANGPRFFFSPPQ